MESLQIMGSTKLQGKLKHAWGEGSEQVQEETSQCWGRMVIYRDGHGRRVTVRRSSKMSYSNRIYEGVAIMGSMKGVQ